MAIQEMSSTIDQINEHILQLGSRLDTIEQLFQYARGEHTQTTMVSERFDKLEQIFILVDWLKLENICEHILQEPSFGQVSDPCGINVMPTQCEQISYDMWDAFGKLKGMVQISRVGIGQILLSGPTFNDLQEPEGMSILQQLWVSRSKSAAQVVVAREAWRP